MLTVFRQGRCGATPLGALSMILMLCSTVSGSESVVDDAYSIGLVKVVEYLELVYEGDSPPNITELMPDIVDAVKFFPKAFNALSEQGSDEHEVRLSESVNSGIELELVKTGGANVTQDTGSPDITQDIGSLDSSPDSSRSGLRGSNRKLVRYFRNYVIAGLSFSSTCFRCPRPGFRTSFSYRRLIASNGTIPSFGDLPGIPSIGSLIEAQNKLIWESGNVVVKRVSEFRSKALSLAAEARVAAENVKIQSKYIESLEKEAKLRKEETEHAVRQIKKSIENAKKMNQSPETVKQLKLMEEELRLHNEMLDEYLSKKNAELELLKEVLKGLEKEASDSEKLAEIADKEALKYEKEAAIRAQEEVERKNYAQAKNNKSLDRHIKLFDAKFEQGHDEFEYAAGIFNGTHHPKYSKGYRKENHDQNHVLKMELGGVDGESVGGISGGWTRAFTLERDARSVQIVFDYTVKFLKYFDSNKFARIVGSVGDIALESEPGSGVLETIVGQIRDDHYVNSQTFAAQLGHLPAGSHDVKLGAFLNGKTRMNERMDLEFDNIIILVDYADV